MKVNTLLRLAAFCTCGGLILQLAGCANLNGGSVLASVLLAVIQQVLLGFLGGLTT